jgi:predicted RNase H-like nuclease (RuvC/YqgF family)
MSNKFIDSLKHVIIEDDEPKAEGQAQAHLQPHAQPHTEPAPALRGNTVAPPVAAPTDSSAYQTMSGQPMSEETEHVYQRILAKTNFAATPVSATIHKYLDPLSAIPALDERTKFKTAVIQAKAQEGLSQEKILATFDGLKVALQNEQESFAASAEQTKQQEIANRQKKVQEITDAISQKQREIAQLQQRLSEVTTELVGAQGKIQRAESQFTIAAQRRALEIDQEKAKYVSLLQG